MPDDIEKEIEDIAMETMAKNMPPFPTQMDVNVLNFPVDKDPVIEVNVPEIKVPEPKVTVNVPAPIVNIDAPEIPPVDLSEIAKGLKDVSDKLTSLIEKEQEKFDYSKFEDIAKRNKSTFSGNSGGVVTFPIVKQMEATENQVSKFNSSTTALGIAGVYTGTWEDVSKFDSITIAIATDKAGTYSLQFSPDASNVDSTLTRYHKDNEIHVPHRFTVTRKYARVVFTNTSGEAQTYFRLQTLLGEKEQLNAPLDGILAQDFDATVVRPTDFRYEAALGLRQGHTTWSKFGYNTDVDTGTEVIAPFGGTFTPRTTATTLTIVSEVNAGQPFILNSGDVFWMEATTDQNNTNVSGRFTLIEVKDVDAS